MNTVISRSALIAASALVLSLSLAGCAGSAGTAPAGTTTSDSASQAATPLTLTDAWTKSAKTGDMTAAFGTLTNDGDTDLTVSSAVVTLSGAAAASEIELHETVMDASGNMTMRPIDGGFTVPAHGSLVLEPGGNHIMLMGLTADLVAGDEVSITLALTDGSTLTVEAPVKDFTGANENYSGDGMSGMDHGEHTSDPTP
ncbi:copper chaperone PCu(A)C [Microbacterium sp. ZW T5_56]|uniref:copper chaperone PCu(A)C n=1 Tax=Microbacterium sp. ZW T5_56 TaxID=3378081 RepID=UPI00385508B1